MIDDDQFDRPTGPIMTEMLVRALDNIAASPDREVTIRALAESGFYARLDNPDVDSRFYGVLQALAVELGYHAVRAERGLLPSPAGGRRMTRYLAEALDDITGTRRRVTIQALSEGDNEVAPSVPCVVKDHRQLMHAVVRELHRSALREDLTLQGIKDTSTPPPTGELGIPGHVPEPPALTGEPLILDDQDGRG